jgi:ubiquinone/menaquinone biosynthesis C-methylase UbiE
MSYSEVVRQKKDLLMDKEKIRGIIEKNLMPIAKERILEIGCNVGDDVKYFQEYADIYGIDSNKDAIINKVTKNILLRDAVNSDFPDESFDKIYSSHAIEHIQDKYKLFGEMDRILKPVGKLILIYPFELFRGMATIRVALQVKIAPHRIHLHIYYPRKIEKIIKQTRLIHLYSKFFFARTPQWLTVLTKG